VKTRYGRPLNATNELVFRTNEMSTSNPVFMAASAETTGKDWSKSVFPEEKLKTEPTFKEALELMKKQFNNRV
jgi:hypothetical protein